MARAASILCLLAVAVSSCGKGNGIPDDLERLLSAKGISVHVLGYDAPVRSRAGYVYFAQDEAVTGALVAAFGLREVEFGTPGFAYASKRIQAPVTRAYILAGRPPSLKLASGAQLECLFLLLSADGRAFLYSEYAYG